MEHNYIEKRYNVMGLSSIDAFSGIKGGMNGNCKDVYFLRVTGANNTLVRDIEHMDAVQTEKMLRGQCIYNRIGTFPKAIGTDDARIYTECYDKWEKGQRTLLFTKNLGSDSGMGELLSSSCKKVLEVYKGSRPNWNDSIEKNFVVKLLFWTDELAVCYLRDWNPRQSMKFVAQGVLREQEYLFCYFLTLLGIDVLLLQNAEDIDGKMDGLRLSEKLVLGEKKEIPLGAYDRNKAEEEHRAANVSVPAGRTEERSPVRVTIPPAAGRRTAGKQTPAAQEAGRVKGQESQNGGKSCGRELTFEELALKASSVVMIAIHNNKGDVIGTGSGIMIGPEGYILTNNHVARGGMFYSVRIENDDAIYKTDQIIKYNSLLDLAVIRIDRRLQPLPVYKGNKPLVRWQKVVAIGSPLGLFNSISDGIISGFRKIDNVDMIQFTAPISHGSSGGAVLNMYGEVIGVSTAGYDDGQNINLAVGYEFVNTFISGFQ